MPESRALMFCVLTLTASPAGSALAQEEAYRGIVEEAVAEFNRSNFAEAHALFRRSHELAPSARSLRGLGMALFELHRYREALQHLRASLTDERRPLDETQREHVRNLIERSTQYVGRFRVSLDPPSATISVDGQVFDPSEELVLDIGEHQLIIEADGRVREERTLQVDGRESEPLQIVLALSEPAAVLAPAAVPIMGPTVLALGGAALLSGLVIGGLSLGMDSDFRGVCDAPTCPTALRPQYDDMRTFSIAADALMLAGGLIAALGLVLTFTLVESETSTTVSTACTHDGCLAIVEGSF